MCLDLIHPHNLTFLDAVALPGTVLKMSEMRFQTIKQETQNTFHYLQIFDKGRPSEFRFSPYTIHMGTYLSLSNITNRDMPVIESGILNMLSYVVIRVAKCQIFYTEQNP